jgi:hypothetical protein
MKEYIKFDYVSGPHGDATCWYTVKTSAKTVGEFIDLILAGVSNDNYATIVLRHKAEYRKEAAIAYIMERQGVFNMERKCQDYEEYRAVKFTEAKANGGWGAMSYDLFTEDDFKNQERDDFMLTYFGWKR